MSTQDSADTWKPDDKWIPFSDSELEALQYDFGTILVEIGQMLPFARETPVTWPAGVAKNYIHITNLSELHHACLELVRKIERKVPIDSNGLATTPPDVADGDPPHNDA